MCDHARMTGRPCPVSRSVSPTAAPPRPRRRRATRLGPGVRLLIALPCLAGCTGDGGATTGPGTWTEAPAPISVDGRPVALVDGAGVPWLELRPRLLEAAGAEVLADWILDQRLEAAILDAGIRVDPAMLEAEQSRLLDRLAPDADDAARLLAELRDRRNLGPVRFAALLRRNAALRALVGDAVTVSEAQVRAAFDVAHGPRRQVRLMILPDLAAATAARADAASGDRTFAEIATERSLDLSAARGGLLEPFAERDPAMPEALRRAAFSLAADGDLSPPVLLSGGAAVLQLVSILPGDGTTFAEGRAEAARAAREAAQRVAMEQVARELVGDATVTAIDPSLRDAWERRRRRLAPGS